MVLWRAIGGVSRNYTIHSETVFFGETREQIHTEMSAFRTHDLIWIFI